MHVEICLELALDLDFAIDQSLGDQALVPANASLDSPLTHLQRDGQPADPFDHGVPNDACQPHWSILKTHIRQLLRPKVYRRYPIRNAAGFDLCVHKTRRWQCGEGDP
jgi:hypothetical protein